MNLHNRRLNRALSPTVKGLWSIVALQLILSSAAWAGAAVAPVPEPESVLLLGTAVAAVGFIGWRLRRKKG